MIPAELRKALYKSFRLIFSVTFISFHKIISFSTFPVFLYSITMNKSKYSSTGHACSERKNARKKILFPRRSNTPQLVQGIV